MTVDWRTPDRQPHACYAPHRAPVGLEIHHIPSHAAHNPDELARTCQRVYDYHVGSQGMDDIWYQHVVALDGSVAVGRGFDCASYTDVDHDGDVEQVPRHTVALVGDYDHAQVTHAQRVTLGRLEQRVVERGGGRDHSYHAARAATACPGSNVIAALNSGVLTQPPPSEEDPMAPDHPHIDAAVVDGATDGKDGYHLLDEWGGVHTFGTATNHGSVPALVAEGRIDRYPPGRAVAVAVDADGDGYRVFWSDGSVFAFDASYRGRVVAEVGG